MAGAWATAVLVAPAEGQGSFGFAVFIAPPVSAVFWVATAEWFRRKRLGVVPALVFGAVSPLLGSLVFGFWGVFAILQNLPLSMAFGLGTSYVVHFLACSTTEVATGA